MYHDQDDALAMEATDESSAAHSRVRELARRLETVREDERRAIARRLHEGIAQELHAVKLIVSRLQKLRDDRASTRLACKDLNDAIDRCLGTTRYLADDLRPQELTQMNLTGALTEYAKRFAENAGFNIHVVAETPFPELDATTILVFLRAAREALTNVARHARASAVSVVLRADDEFLRMDIADDGIGLDDAALVKAGSLGLLTMRENIGALGGEVSVRAEIEAGTTLSVRIPRPES